MIEYLTSFPTWFWMMIIMSVVAVGLYKVIRADKIKAGPVEIEEDDSDEKDVSKIPEKNPVIEK